MFTTFRTRLLAIIVVINLFVLVLGGAAYYFLGEIGGRLGTFSQGIYARLEISNQLREAADARAIAVRNMALLNDPAARGQQLEEFKRRQAETLRAVQALTDAVSGFDVPEAVRAKVAAISNVESRYRPVAEDIVQRLQDGRREEALRQIEQTCTPTLRELMAAIHDYAALTQQRTKAYVSETETITRQERIALLLTAITAAVVAASMGALLLRSVHTTLGCEPEFLKSVLSRMAAGDLSSAERSRPSNSDSIYSAVLRMQEQFGLIVQRVRSSSDRIATGSSQIATGNADLSQRTEEQASALQRTAATMDEIGSTIRDNAENAKQANQEAQAAAELASKGGHIVAQVVSTMQNISQSSREIGTIIGVIDGIAFQTNILALNASVEAARAGEQGRGFAVVASEVRNLAQRSADAAREIKSLIGRNVEQVEQGTQLVGSAGQTMGEVVGSIRRVSLLVSEITDATVEQSRGVEQIGAAVSQMDQVTQQNAGLVEQSAAAARSLKGQASELVSVVAAIKLAA